MIYDGTESVKGGTGWYLVVLGHYNFVLVGIKWLVVLFEESPTNFKKIVKSM